MGSEIVDRKEALKALRKERAETLEAAQTRLKEQNRFRKEIMRVLDVGPQTVPEIAAATGLPAEKVFWHLTAMKKYGLIVEVGEDGDYYRYGLCGK